MIFKSLQFEKWNRVQRSKSTPTSASSRSNKWRSSIIRKWPKAFAIPILTESDFYWLMWEQLEIRSKCIRISFHFRIILEHHAFLWSLANLFLYLFDLQSCFIKLQFSKISSKLNFFDIYGRDCISHWKP